MGLTLRLASHWATAGHARQQVGEETGRGLALRLNPLTRQKHVVLDVERELHRISRVGIWREGPRQGVVHLSLLSRTNQESHWVRRQVEQDSSRIPNQAVFERTGRPQSASGRSLAT